MKVESFYFSHDYHARNDRKLIKIKNKLGMIGIGIYWCIVELLYEESGKILLSEIPFIAEEFKTHEKDVLSVVNDFELFKINGKYFWSESVKRRLDKRLEKSNKAKESVRIRWQNTNVLRTHNDRYTIKESKVKESKVKDIDSSTANAVECKSFKNWTLEEFKNDISANKEILGEPPEDVKALLNKFYLYWTEKSPSGKMKFQLQKTWETHKRLIYWANNDFDKK